jgi:hypothetical protein
VNKDYKVKTTFKDPAGKWSYAIKDSAFIESSHFFKLYSKLIKEKMMVVLERNK